MNTAHNSITKGDDFTIILPTFNEQKNISKMIRTLSELLPGVHIIVSDDGSTDGTKEDVCSKCFEENRDVYEDFKNSRKPIYIKEESN